ncbi:hypothetical protein AAVH_09991 [Aphelenchoides avenae]|nr:hypothetical protein AAVH_09991 [Aphelenchus avenae]
MEDVSRKNLFLVYDNTLRVLTYVDITVQLYVILVMLAATPEKMRQYRYFMLLYTTCDLAFAMMIGVAVHPGTVLHQPCATLRGLLQSLDRDQARYALPLAVFCGVAVLGTQDYCIIYRGAVVWREGRYLQRLVAKKAKLIALLAITGFASLTSFVGYFIATVTEYNPEKDPIILASLNPGSDAWVCVTTAKSPIWPMGQIVFPLAFATEAIFYVLAIERQDG